MHFFRGFKLRSKVKFPYQIVQRRAEILKTIPEDQRELGRNLRPDDLADGAAIQLRLYLHHHECRFSLKVPVTCGFESLVMLYRPEDFVSDGF